jgi:hypothetical protein
MFNASLLRFSGLFLNLFKTVKYNPAGFDDFSDFDLTPVGKVTNKLSDSLSQKNAYDLSRYTKNWGEVR